MISSRPADVLPDSAPLGFLNPWLYSNQVRIHKGLKDIVQGSNPGCGTTGFEARVGWDPVRPVTLASRNFRRWMIWYSVGHGSRDAELSTAAIPPKTETFSRPYSDCGANARSNGISASADPDMTTCCRLDLSYVPVIQIRASSQCRPTRLPALHNIAMTHS